MDNNELAGNCSVLVPSCDKYSDLWRPFFTLFWRYWPYCPFPVYLGSNHETFDHPKVKTIAVGDDKDWTSGVRKMLKSVKTEYVLIILEDFFIREPISTSRINYSLKALSGLNGHMLRLCKPISRPYWKVEGYPDLVGLMEETPYRVNLQPTIWKLDSLFSIMNDGESAWEFEVYGSKRSSDTRDGFFCFRSERPLEWKQHVVEKGKWFLSEARWCQKAALDCDFSRRPIITKAEQVKYTLRKKKGRLEEKIVSWTLRKRIGRILRNLKGSKDIR